MMEEIGPEATKRPRLDQYGGPPPNSMHRLHQQLPESPLPLHTYPAQAHPSQALRPPSAYSQPLPPSPYESAHDRRSLPEPAPQQASQQPPQHAYGPSHSGYSTPIRDSRPYQTDPTYSRHGSGSAPRRSPDEGAPPTILRPLNTASANEGQHYPPHPHPEPVGNAVGPPAGYGAHEGSQNGVAHGLSMSTHHDPSHRPPHLGQMAGYVESPVGAGAGQTPYSAGPYGNHPDWRTMQQAQRKNTRAQQACDTCRSRKAKCDEGKPMCGYCKDNNQQCRYKEVAPPKADRAQKEIMDQLKAIGEKVDRLEARLERPNSGYGASVSRSNAFENDIRNIPQHSANTPPDRKPLLSSHGAILHEADLNEHRADRQNTNSGMLPSEEGSYGSIVIDHTTGAHRLLRWPTIKALLRHRTISEDYVMETEERKGLLRLYGRGQGRDTYDGGPGGPASPAASTSSGRSDETGRSPASSPPDIWGTALYPSTAPDATRNHDHPGGLNADGSLKLDWATMERLHYSYLSKLHILHPFLNKSRLGRMFRRVSEQVSSSEAHPTRSPFVQQSTGAWGETALNRPVKRKHTDSSSDANTPSSRGGKEQLLERRVSTAIVLLVMALGKICEHKGPLPGPIPESLNSHTHVGESPFYSDSPPTFPVKPSPTTSSASVSMSSPSMNESQFRYGAASRRSSADPQGYASGSKPERNVDVIPGLAYYARAAEILGTLNGGQDLMHVQASLLASLYVSQMACVLESWSWIQNACRACHFLVRDPTLRKEVDLTRADMIRFAYWTSVQFESDILAELDLRRSGIERAEHESEIQYPNGVSEDSTNLGDLNKPEALILAYYSFQISLRTTLNKIQTILYPPGAPNHGQISLVARDECEQMLKDWLKVLPPQLRWNDSDPPATDINVARLRAKYYGARYIIHRPFLNYALHSPSLRESIDRHLESLPNYGSPSGRYEGAMAPPTPRPLNPRENDQVKEILRSAKLCIDAATQSTEAFDGVRQRERLVVTNIFGTAHAQFGNMLVLAATYRSHLSKLVDKQDFDRLLDRTIAFLRELAPISTTLEADASILMHVKKIIHGEAQASTSFTTTHS